MEVNFLFCSHPLDPKQVDEGFEAEYQAAGLDHPCALFSYEDFSEGKLRLSGEKISGLTIYRGWMMKPELYRDLYGRLEERGILLINTPEEYERYHLLPGWYGEFAAETAQTAWTSGNNIDDALQLAKRLDAGAYIVKDHVKSRKHEWYDACFIGNIRDAAAAKKVIGNFIERQGEDLVGGVALRKFENLKKAGFHSQSGMPLSEEYRVFIYAGKVLTINSYWHQDAKISFTEEEFAWVESIAGRVKSTFVTVDLARKENGSLIIMEFGDGQVSGLQQLEAEEFYKSFRRQGQQP
ncbi:MAG: ATP-grasp domain-containing protein [Subdoligranulum sp.]|nr:ATP-grasp domain-containing protein [Subdoligranulum sp.]